ncbi:MAG: SAM-dependent methyltransferase [Blautia sp.]|nr:SAM-dependent methyltransferase [Blautia sp.]
MTLAEYLELQIDENLILAVLSSRKNKDAPEKVKIHPVMIKGQVMYQAESYAGTQVFHQNLDRPELEAFLTEMLQTSFGQLQCQGREVSGTVLSGKKGNLSIRMRRMREKKEASKSREPARIAPHNRVKKYLLQEGIPVPFLIDLGVMTEEGKVVARMYDKFRQINRFLEFIEDILPKLPKDREVTILDFGCGKSYLSFAMYYFLRELRGYDVRIIGLDLKEDVIRRCAALAEKYGYEKLSFTTGDVADYRGVSSIDMMVTLHACDTATDYALARAVQWGAGVILSVPCCQHEVNRQIRNDLLSPLLEYGILKERMSALITDGVRAELLCAMGYDTQILEFIDMEHTPKNLMIRAVHTGKKKDPEAVERILREFHINPSLYRLFYEESKASPGSRQDREQGEQLSVDCGSSISEERSVKTCGPGR